MRVSLLAGALMLTGTAMAQDTAPIGAGDRIIDPIWEGRSAVYAQNGAAATAHPLATEIAIQTLKDGGSAVDAAIAANAALGLMEPTGNGIGGDLFAIVWDPETQEVYGLNGSGRSPQSLTRAKLDEALDGATAMPPYGAIPSPYRARWMLGLPCMNAGAPWRWRRC